MANRIDSDRARDDRPFDHSPLASLRYPAFRTLWTIWLIANICMWMNDTTTAWVMTTLTADPVWVALVQTASTLPVFLFGLLSGALADRLDRRNYLLFTQVWVAGVALLLAAATLLQFLSAPLLLALSFANGIGLAMRWPVYAALVPGLVPPTRLGSALALSGISMNGSRVIGPLVAGALIASAGSSWVFVLNAVLSVLAAIMLGNWRWERPPAQVHAESLLRAIGDGFRFVAASAPFKGVMLRVVLFFFHMAATLALLPLIARRLDGDSGTYSLLLAAFGLGAVVAGLLYGRLERPHGADGLAVRGMMLQAAATANLGLGSTLWITLLAMFLSGISYLATANPLIVSAQSSVPDWVRARAMSILQVTIMGSSAVGAALWGQVASAASIGIGLCAAAATASLGIFHIARQRVAAT